RLGEGWGEGRRLLRSSRIEPLTRPSPRKRRGEGAQAPMERNASRAPTEKFSGKIQSIYNGKCAPITMQGFATARENPPAQEQWRTIEKTMRKTMRRAIGTVGHPGACRRPVGRRTAGDGAARESPPREPS